MGELPLMLFVAFTLVPKSNLSAAEGPGLIYVNPVGVDAVSEYHGRCRLIIGDNHYAVEGTALEAIQKLDSAAYIDRSNR